MKFDKSMTTLSFTNGHLNGQNGNHSELSRLVAAAVISQEFRRQLLSNPQDALASGYYGTPFELADEEKAFILSIQTTSLTDFADQLAKRQNGNGVAHKNGFHNPLGDRRETKEGYE